MSNYSRVWHPGGTYFFTAVTHARWPWFRDPHAVAALTTALSDVRQRHPFESLALVVLPDHVHCMWKLPDGDSDFSLRWQLLKKRTTHALGGGASIWQRRFWEHLIRDENDFARHCDYIHFNPVKHGLAANAASWPYSTFRRLVAQGVYAQDWGIEEPKGLKGMHRE